MRGVIFNEKQKHFYHSVSWVSIVRSTPSILGDRSPSMSPVYSLLTCSILASRNEFYFTQKKKLLHELPIVLFLTLTGETSSCRVIVRKFPSQVSRFLKNTFFWTKRSTHLNRFLRQSTNFYSKHKNIVNNLSNSQSSCLFEFLVFNIGCFNLRDSRWRSRSADVLALSSSFLIYIRIFSLNSFRRAEWSLFAQGHVKIISFFPLRDVTSLCISSLIRFV